MLLNKLYIVVNCWCKLANRHSFKVNCLNCFANLKNPLMDYTRMMKYMCCESQAIGELIPLDIYKLLLGLDTFAGCIMQTCLCIMQRLLKAVKMIFI